MNDPASTLPESLGGQKPITGVQLEIYVFCEAQRKSFQTEGIFSSGVV